MSWPHPIKAVIFDVDGLLLDSEGIFSQTVLDITGQPLTDELHLKIMGTIGPVCFRILMEGLNITNETQEAFTDRFIAHLNSLLPKSPLMPGAEDIIRKFHGMGVPMALATGSNTDNLEAKTTNHRALFDLIPVATCGNEVSKGKPDPEVFLKSMQKLGINDPSSCLVFEDSPGGIKAAVSAGMAAVMIPDKSLPYERLLSEFGVKPTLMLDSLCDFDTKMFDFTCFQ